MAVTRELSITYGSLVINETNGRFIDGKIQINKGYTMTTVIFGFVVRKDTEANFAAEIAAVEDAFRAPFRNLEIKQGTNVLLSLSHTANTGINAKPTIVKSEHPADTGRSRRYTVTIVFDMPADNVASFLASGLRESSIDVRFSPSGRRTVTISGVFTALASNTARQQYEATIDAYATSILTALGGIYELAEKPRTDADGTNKILSFTHVYDELIYEQGGKVGLDDAELARQQFSMSLVKSYPGDTKEEDVNRMVTVTISYDVWVSKTQTNLKTKWEQIKTWLVNTAKTVYSLSSVALVDENATLNQDDNRITASLTLRGALKASNVIEMQITYGFEDVWGYVLVPVWSGDALAKYLYQGPRTSKLTISMTAKLMGEMIVVALNNLARARKYLTGGNIIPVSSRQDSRPLVIGQAPNTHIITEFSAVDVFELYRSPGVVTVGAAVPRSIFKSPGGAGGETGGGAGGGRGGGWYWPGADITEQIQREVFVQPLK